MINVRVSKVRSGLKMWLYFDKIDQVGGGKSENCMAKCKDCGTTVKVSKDNTINLMSHLQTRHPKIHKIARKKNA